MKSGSLQRKSLGIDAEYFLSDRAAFWRSMSAPYSEPAQPFPVASEVALGVAKCPAHRGELGVLAFFGMRPLV